MIRSEEKISLPGVPRVAGISGGRPGNLIREAVVLAVTQEIRRLHE
jgi:hypothetical protein